MSVKLYLAHQTSLGERWDTLSYHYYGSPLQFGLLLQANPHLPFMEELPAGLTVIVPVIQASPSKDNLPPWLRGESNANA